MFAEIKGKSLIDVRESTAFTLATARKESGIQHAEKLIAEFIIETANALNMMSAVSESSIQAMAEDVYSIGYFLNVEELAYFFKQLRRGNYGELYNNLNSIKLCSALNKFILERLSYFEDKSAQSHQADKETPTERTNSMSELRNAINVSVKRYGNEKGS